MTNGPARRIKQWRLVTSSARGNRQRDEETNAELIKHGWRPARIWKPRVVSADGIGVICWDEAALVKTKVFVSYDFDRGKILYDFIIGQAKLPDSPFRVSDHSLN